MVNILDWGDIKVKRESDVYKKIVNETGKHTLIAVIRGLTPFGHSDPGYEQYAYGYQGVSLASHIIIALVQDEKISSDELEDIFQTMISEQHFSILALKYVLHYLEFYLPMTGLDVRRWQLDYKKLIAQFNQHDWRFEDRDVEVHKNRVAQEINQYSEVKVNISEAGTEYSK